MRVSSAHLQGRSGDTDSEFSLLAVQTGTFAWVGVCFLFFVLLGGRFYLGAVLENCYPGLLDRNQTFKQQEGEKKSEKRR